jgi:four helix bundle protein
MGEYLLKERSFRFSVKLLKYFRTLSADREFDILKRQLIRSGASIGANITEGLSGTSRKELNRYLRISLRSCNETTYWLQLIMEVYTSNVDLETLEGLISESSQISKMLNKSISTLASRPDHVQKQVINI